MQTNWPKCTLDDILSVSSGSGLTEANLKPGSHKVYGGNGMVGYHNDFTHKNKELIIGRVGAHCGNVFISDDESWITDNALIVKFNQPYFFIKFWYYYLSGLNLRSFAFQSAQPVITGGILKSIPVAFPKDESQQKKIAKILSTCDSVIEKTEQAIAKYQALKQGMMHDLFTRGIDIATGKLRPSYDDAPELYKDSELGWIPKDWTIGQFIDFADSKISHSFTGGPFGSDLQTKHYTQEGVRIIQLQNIGDGYFKNDYKIYTSKERADYLSACNIFPNEIIISKMADPIARACIIPDYSERYLMASDGIRLAFEKSRFNQRFVLETINQRRFRNIAELRASGTTRARIGLGELKEIPVCYPHITEQNLIGDKLELLEAKLKSEQSTLSKYQQLKQGLMQDLLTGKVEVTADSNEVAQ